MKKNILTAILASAALLVSCNPGDKELAGYVFQERNIVSIAFEHQIGDAVITSLDETTGLVEVKLAVDYIDDLKAVNINSFVIAYGATSSVKRGDTMDLTAAKPAISVTSQAGQTRVYEIVMTPFAEDFAGNYAITGSILVGGLGADDGWGWGTMGMGAPEERPWCWDTNGYGPAANYDNYLEITLTSINDDGSTEGTCVNYGGADGKHWNCIIYKTDIGLVTDVHKYYRVIPIGESTWRRDYSDNTITFTSAEGVKTTCTIFTGTVEVSATHGKSFDIPSQALGFAIAGDYTWDDSLLYTDYQKFGVAARYCFLMVSKVDEIPAASKVIGDEGDISIPDPGTDPDPDPDPEPEDNYSGTYKVTNLKVLGGVGSTGVVEVKDKSWMWNSSVNKEYDNLLVVDLKAGTVDYQAGADGAYWDYVLVADKNKLGTGDMDLSQNYGRLPHSQVSLSVDTATGVTTINGNVMAQVCPPGTYPLSVGWATSSGQVTVPEGSVALVFQCSQKPDSEYEWDASWAYTDFERFALRPFYFVMIFAKQE